MCRSFELYVIFFKKSYSADDSRSTVRLVALSNPQLWISDIICTLLSMVVLVAIISNVDLIVSNLLMIIYVCTFIYNLYFLPLNKYVFSHYNMYISR